MDIYQFMLSISTSNPIKQALRAVSLIAAVAEILIVFAWMKFALTKVYRFV
jgi:hypothetical protein